MKKLKQLIQKIKDFFLDPPQEAPEYIGGLVIADKMRRMNEDGK